MQQGLTLVFYAYVLSIGFGMVLGQARGAKKAHQVWVKMIRGLFSFVLHTGGDFLHWVEKAIKR
jgi:hypothetical protein